PFKHLGSLAIALDHPYVDADRVARSNSGQVAAPLQLQQISKFRHNSAGTCGEYTRRLSGFSATPGAPGAHEPGWRGAKLAGQAGGGGAQLGQAVAGELPLEAVQ